jgi:hypothetical protein
LRTYALDLVFVEVWDEAYDNPGKRTAEVDNLVHHEGHDTGRQSVILNVGIPCSPEELQGIEFLVILADLIVVAPERVGRSVHSTVGRIPSGGQLFPIIAKVQLVVAIKIGTHMIEKELGLAQEEWN